ncbi:MAG: hypothetical protein RSA87_03925 [Malacoplasma sp.]
MAKMHEVEVITIEEHNQFMECLEFVREDLHDDPYILETLKVLPVGGYRSAIGSFWNAVVDDLRKKIIFRSLDLFNKEMKAARIISCYDDFQNYVNDEMLIDGAYKMGIIGWEAQKVLKQAKETRHIFDGHPSSSDPTPLKTLSMMEDCVKYVLSREFSPKIIDIDEYINTMGTEDFDRNEISISNALADLPENYLTDFINKLFNAYVDPRCSSILRSNIEIVAPILWKNLTKDTCVQVCLRVDTEITRGNIDHIDYAFDFVNLVDCKKYLSPFSKRYKLEPIIKELNNNLDQFSVENKCVEKLSNFAGFIPRELLLSYINGITQTYVGRVYGSYEFTRTDFFADRAAMQIPAMFNMFDNESADYFIEVIKTNTILKDRIKGSNVKLRRLRALGQMVLDRVSTTYKGRQFLVQLVDETREKEFFKLISND